MSEIEDEIRRQMQQEQSARLNGHPYSGAPWHAQPSAELPDGSDGPANPYNATPPARPASRLERLRDKGGITGAIATVLLMLAKIGAPVIALLVKFKVLLVALKLFWIVKIFFTAGTMLLSMWVYARYFGWPFAVGLVMLIFIHECGHALAAVLRGIKVRGMMFIPFMGGVVSTGHGRSLGEDAFIGIMGPVVGSIAAAACVGIYFATGAPVWMALAQWGFFVNLINLAPIPPLDGGWIAPLFSAKLFFVGLVVVALVWHNPIIWILIVLSIPRMLSYWKADPKSQPYFKVSARERWVYGVSYVALASVLGICMNLTQAYISSHLTAIM